MHSRFLTAGLLAALFCAATPSAAREDVPRGLEKLQGTWNLVSVTSGGRTTAMTPGAYTLTVKGSQWKFGHRDREPEVGTYKVDTGGKLPALDVEITEGKRKGTTMLAVFEVKGKVLKLCLGTSKDRPTELTGKGKHTLETYQKVK